MHPLTTLRFRLLEHQIFHVGSHYVESGEPTGGVHLFYFGIHPTITNPSSHMLFQMENYFWIKKSLFRIPSELSILRPTCGVLKKVLM